MNSHIRIPLSSQNICLAVRCLNAWLIQDCWNFLQARPACMVIVIFRPYSIWGRKIVKSAAFFPKVWNFLDMGPGYDPGITHKDHKDDKNFMQFLSSFWQTSWIRMLKTLNMEKFRCPVRFAG